VQLLSKEKRKFWVGKTGTELMEESNGLLVENRGSAVILT
jgi:hypothetical protein